MYTTFNFSMVTDLRPPPQKTKGLFNKTRSEYIVFPIFNELIRFLFLFFELLQETVMSQYRKPVRQR